MIILIALAIYFVIWRFWPNSFSNTISVNENSIDSVSVHAMVNHFGIEQDTIDTYLIGENEQQMRCDTHVFIVSKKKMRKNLIENTLFRK